MADDLSDPTKRNSADSTRQRRDGFPSNEELLNELRLHGAKPQPLPNSPLISRRTRDFLLCTGFGSIVIGVSVFRLLGSADSGNAMKLATTCIAAFLGLMWFVFYGVMNRY